MPFLILAVVYSGGIKDFLLHLSQLNCSDDVTNKLMNDLSHQVGQDIYKKNIE